MKIACNCSIKECVTADTAYASVDMAVKGSYIYNVHGINGGTPGKTMQNMGRIALAGMADTEKTIVDILKEKRV